MKFLIFSLIGISAFIQQAKAQINPGFQPFGGNLNILGSSTPTVQNPLPTLNLGAQNLPNFNILQQNQNDLLRAIFANQQIPSFNPLDFTDPSRLTIFDNQRQLCFSPRVWDGQSCKCPNGGIFLSGRCQNQNPEQLNKDLLTLRQINRNFNGTQNNPNNPEWGARAAELLRLCPANYEDGKGKILQNLPNPRDISNLVADTEGKIIESKLGLNMLFTNYGQMIDHDISHTPSIGLQNMNINVQQCDKILNSPCTGGQNMNIKIPKCDKVMDKSCTGKEQFPIRRSIITSRKDVRTPVNIITSWIDANFVYGSDIEVAKGLRELKNGKLRTSEGNILPRDKNGMFQAGDTRVNQLAGLTIFHNLFLREHNRLCDKILAKNPTLTDEEVYQIARNYVIGLVQHITYDEYLPTLLGRANYDALIGPYRYDPTANPNTINEFSTAAFRFGHPMVNGPLKLMDDVGNVVKTFQVGQLFFRPDLLTNTTLDQFMNGFIRMASKQRSLTIIEEIRNFLVESAATRTIKTDLFAFNVQRSRDHGTCSLGVTRQKLGLPKKAFKDLFEDQAKASILEKLFHDPSNVDLWLGIIGEKSEPGSPLGELGIRLNALQFKLMRNGDRFWYEGVYPESIVKEIKATTLADVIKRNTGVKNIGSDAFKKLF